MGQSRLEDQLHRLMQQTFGVKLGIGKVALPCRIRQGSCMVDVPVIKLVSAMQHLLAHCPTKILPGATWAQEHLAFWEQYRLEVPTHPVFTDHGDHLGRCIPISLHGDEGRGAGKSGFLVVNVSPNFCQGRSSLLSRIVLLGLPSKAYVVHAKRNRMFEATLHHLGAELLAGYTTGVAVPWLLSGPLYLVCTAVRGDWQFLQKALNLNRSYGHAASCHMCMACRSGPFSFRNIKPDAPWRHAGIPTPWARESGLVMQVPGLRHLAHVMVKPDILHMWHLGVARDFMACSLIELSSDYRGGIEARLRAVWGEFGDWAAVHKVRPLLTSFTKENLHWKPRLWPCLNCKASDAILFCRFIADACGNQALHPLSRKNGLIAACSRAMDRLLEKLEDEGLFTRPSQRSLLSGLGVVVVRSYMQLHVLSLQAGLQRYKLRPKFHMLVHMAEGLLLNSFNWRWDACWMDEDIVGKVSRLSRRVHPMTCALRTLQRYMLAMSRHWRD